MVLTCDPQGQGQSDTFGEGADRNEGFPAQTDGRPFFDGTEDALNFFFSTPSHPYEPVRAAASTGTSHAAKQDGACRPASTPPTTRTGKLLDRRASGLAGHSYGAAGVSYIGQWDPRVKAIVAWDNLGRAGSRARTTAASRPARRAARRTPRTARRRRSPSRRSACRPTTSCRRRPNTSRTRDPGSASRPSRSTTSKARRRHRRDHHPRRLAPRLLVHPEPGLRRLAARRRRDRLVHHRLVRQVREARPDAPTRGCSRTAGATTPPRPPSTRTTTATCSPSTTRRGSTSGCRTARALRLRGHARGLRAAVGQRRLPRRVLLRRDRHIAGPVGTSGLNT